MKMRLNGLIFSLLITTASCASDDVVVIPAGVFIMGSNDSAARNEKPEHMVYLDKYEIDRYEVTVEKYVRCVQGNKCQPIGGRDIIFFEKTEPVRQVSWYDAETYCGWRGMRLPTEAEWEKAARGTDGRVNPWGNRKYREGDAALMSTGLVAVGTVPNDKSQYGVSDMAGNVSEWVNDWYSREYYQNSPNRNPGGPKAGDQFWTPGKPTRVVRGGNFRIYPEEQSSFFSTLRWPLAPEVAQPTVGFRCAKSSK